jgi:hypothetical protein
MRDTRLAEGALTLATAQKRRHLLLVIERLLQPEACVQAVVGVGSIASNTANAGSDIDALVFMQPIEEHIVPAESIWCPWDDSFHSIFTPDERVQAEGIQLDVKLCELAQWQRDDAVWDAGQRAGLANAWVAFDRTGATTALIAERTRYADDIRLNHLDRAIIALEGVLLHDAPSRVWDNQVPLVAFDRLNAAGDALVQALFALNRRWLPWRERRMTHVLTLPWLPPSFDSYGLSAFSASAHDRAGYGAQADALSVLFAEVLTELVRDGCYAADPIDEAFIHLHDSDPGRTWDMLAWSHARATRLAHLKEKRT